MKKNAVEDKAEPAGEPAGTEAVFKGDANVLDYLNSLLSSVPAVVLESGETQFVRLAIDEGWKGLDAATALINNAISYHSELSRKEVELLELENKNLKFREELASIDAQVLRGENEGLKEQIAWLIKELDANKTALEGLTVENAGFKARVRFLEGQLADLADIEDAVSPSVSFEAEAGGAETGIEPDGQSDSGLDQPGFQDNEGREVDQVDCERMEAAATEAVECDLVESVDPELVDAVRVASGNSAPNVRRGGATLVLSRSRDMSGAAIWSVKSSSKIIKQQNVESGINTGSPEPDRPVKNPTLPVSPIHEEVIGPEPILPEDPEGFTPLESDPVLSTQGDQDLDLEPVPETTDAMRRKVKNYESLQSEADSADTRNRHTLIL